MQSSFMQQVKSCLQKWLITPKFIKLLLYNKRNLPINNKGKITKYIDDKTDIVDIDSEIEDITPVVILPKKVNIVRHKKQIRKLAGRTGSKRKAMRVRKA